MHPQKGPMRPWCHQPKDEELESPENPNLRNMSLCDLGALPLKPVPRQAAFLFSSTWGGPGFSLAATP